MRRPSRATIEKEVRPEIEQHARQTTAETAAKLNLTKAQADQLYAREVEMLLKAAIDWHEAALDLQEVQPKINAIMNRIASSGKAYVEDKLGIYRKLAPDVWYFAWHDGRFDAEILHKESDGNWYSELAHPEKRKTRHN